MSVAYIDRSTSRKGEYLTIVWGNIKTEVENIKYTLTNYNKIVGVLDASLFSNNVKPTNKTNTLNYFKKAGQFFAYKYTPFIGTRMSSAIDQILTSRKVTDQTIYDIFVQNATDYLDTTARNLGYTDISQFYTDLAPSGSGINPDTFISTFVPEIEKKFIEEKVIINRQKYTKYGLVMNLVESDDDTYSSDIPYRRVESGFSYTDYVFNDVTTRTFKCIIAPTSSRSVLETKELIKSIRASKKTFDVIIYNGFSTEIVKKCLFSNLAFSVSVASGDCLECDMSIRPIEESKQLKTTQVKELRNSTSEDKNIQVKKEVSSTVVQAHSEDESAKVDKDVAKDIETSKESIDVGGFLGRLDYYNSFGSKITR